MIIRTVHRLVGGVYRAVALRSRRSVVGGRTVHFYEGQADSSDHTVLFIHGLGTSSSTWMFTLPRLNIRDHVLAIDLPGFGLSPLRPDEQVPTLQDHLSVLRTLLETTASGSYTLVGHSLGGWLAMLLTLEDPTLVQNLVLLNPAGIWYEGCEQVAAAFDVHSDKDTRRLMDRLWYKFPWYFRPFFKSIRLELQRRRVSELVQTIRPEEFVNDRLSLLPTQVSLIWGSEDKLFSSETVAIVRREVPHARVVIIPRCGHVPQLECPRQTIRALRGALGTS